MIDRPHAAGGGSPWRSWSVLAIACAASAAWPACRPEEPPAPSIGPEDGALVLDLAEKLPVATAEAETTFLEMGDAAARPHLLDGWGVDEEDDAGTYAWSLGERSSLWFFAAAPADVTLGLHCQPFGFAGAPDQTMAVAVNGAPLREIRMGRKLERYRVQVPAERIARGRNVLELAFGYSRRPQDVTDGSADQRSLAARCYRIGLEGLGAEAPASGTPAAPDRIELPSGTAVTYYFDHPSSSALVVGAIRPWGPDAGDVELIVRSTSADAGAETEQVVHPDGGPVRLPLATAGPAVDRLQIAAAADRRGRRGWLARLFGGRPEASGLTLVLPSVREDAEPPAKETADGAPLAGAGGDGRPNVIVYLIDTLRADHLGAYGYPRPTSPNIDRFAADGVLFLDAQAQSSWTRPAVVSLLTGLAPRRHGVNRRQDALADSVDTLAELLAAAGYDTAGFVTNGNAGPNFGLHQGYARFHHLAESADTVHRHQLSDRLNRWLFDWLETRRERRDTKPFFLYAHATDPHVPYTPTEPFRRRFAPDVDPEIGRLDNVRAVIQGTTPPTEALGRDLMDLYDAEIAFNDHHFGRLVERLKALDLYDGSLIVLVSDHGEEFLDHGGWEHGVTLYDEQLHVPLIMKLPGGAAAGERIDATVRQIDLLPTVLDLLGVPSPPVDGVSLLDPSERTSFAHLALQDRHIRSVTRKGWKLILDDSVFPRGRPVQLYDLGTDRRETRELTEMRPFERELLAQVMRSWELALARSARAGGEKVEIPDELRRQLEALGYL